MTTEEKLNAIVAKCRAFLEIAEKRTPGEWEVDAAVTWDKSIGIQPCIVQRNAWTSSEDAAFIAACAGPAEAMARSTIAAIDALHWTIIHTEHQRTRDAAKADLGKILAAWPDELLARKS